jgi:hypothetical protein
MLGLGVALPVIGINNGLVWSSRPGLDLCVLRLADPSYYSVFVSNRNSSDSVFASMWRHHCFPVEASLLACRGITDMSADPTHLDVEGISLLWLLARHVHTHVFSSLVLASWLPVVAFDPCFMYRLQIPARTTWQC